MSTTKTGEPGFYERLFGIAGSIHAVKDPFSRGRNLRGREDKFLDEYQRKKLNERGLLEDDLVTPTQSFLDIDSVFERLMPGEKEEGTPLDWIVNALVASNQLRRTRVGAQSPVPPAYSHCTFEYDLFECDQRYEKQRQVHRIFSRGVHKAPGLYLHGEPGRGKTHLLVAHYQSLEEASANDINARSDVIISLIDSVIEAYNSMYPEYNQVIDHLRETDKEVELPAGYFAVRSDQASTNSNLQDMLSMWSTMHDELVLAFTVNAEGNLVDYNNRVGQAEGRVNSDLYRHVTTPEGGLRYFVMETNTNLLFLDENAEIVDPRTAERLSSLPGFSDAIQEVGKRNDSVYFINRLRERYGNFFHEIREDIGEEFKEALEKHPLTIDTQGFYVFDNLYHMSKTHTKELLGLVIAHPYLFVDEIKHDGDADKLKFLMDLVQAAYDNNERGSLRFFATSNISPDDLFGAETIERIADDPELIEQGKRIRSRLDAISEYVVEFNGDDYRGKRDIGLGDLAASFD